MTAGKRPLPDDWPECSVKVCDKPVYTINIGLCMGHYSRKRFGKSLETALRPKKPSSRTDYSIKKRNMTPGPRKEAPQDPTPKKKMKPLPDQIVAINKLSKVPARLCGDSMGVGKTVTGIGLDFRMRKERPDLRARPTLIVSEKIGLDVWDYHLRAMGVPEEKILVIDPTNREPFVEALKILQDRRRGSKTGTHPQYIYFICHWDVLTRVAELNEKRGAKGTGQPKIEFAHVIADECVPGSTRIETPSGPKPIHAIHKGDVVLGYDHSINSPVWTTVTETVKRLSCAPMYQIDGTNLRATGSHPVWTEGGGYVDLSTLDGMQYTVLTLEDDQGTQAFKVSNCDGRIDMSVVRRQVSSRKISEG